MKTKFNVFYSIQKVFNDIDKNNFQQTKLKWTVVLPVVNVEVAVVDFTVMKEYINIMRSVLQGVCWFWFAHFIVKEFDVKFNVG